MNEPILEQEKWIDAFSLKYHWEYRYSPIICLTLALSTLSDEIEVGYFIAKQEFIIHRHPSLRENLMFIGNVKTKKRVNAMDYLICDSKVIENQNILVEMSSTLIKTNQQLNKKLEVTDHNEKLFTAITKEQVHNFSRLSEDPNHIHKGDSPVVQGMLLLLLIEDYLATKNCFIKIGKITYFAPIKADCKLFFHWETSKKLSGIVNNIKCFTLTIKEEFVCQKN